MLAIVSGEGRARPGHLEAAVHRPHELLETSQASTGLQWSQSCSGMPLGVFDHLHPADKREALLPG